MKSFVGKQNYFEFDSLENWKPVQVEDMVILARAYMYDQTSRSILYCISEAF